MYSEKDATEWIDLQMPRITYTNEVYTPPMAVQTRIHGNSTEIPQAKAVAAAVSTLLAADNPVTLDHPTLVGPTLVELAPVPIEPMLIAPSSDTQVTETVDSALAVVLDKVTSIIRRQNHIARSLALAWG
jgi:hypothetical protein